VRADRTAYFWAIAPLTVSVPAGSAVPVVGDERVVQREIAASIWMLAGPPLLSQSVSLLRKLVTG